MAYETPLTIFEVMRDISNNKYVLPSIQREYVWDTTQIETLFDSIMQDYPIGAFLFGKSIKIGLGIMIFMNFLKTIMKRLLLIIKRLTLKEKTV